MVERHLAKVEVEGPIPFIRSSFAPVDQWKINRFLICMLQVRVLPGVPFGGLAQLGERQAGSL